MSLGSTSVDPTNLMATHVSPGVQNFGVSWAARVVNLRREPNIYASLSPGGGLREVFVGEEGIPSPVNF